MDLPKFLVDQSTHLWTHSHVAHVAVPFILVWALLHKCAPARWTRYDFFVEGMEYLGLVVMMLLVALAFAYGGWVGLGIIAFLLAIR